MNTTQTLPANDEQEILVTMEWGETIRGWVHATKGTSDSIALIVKGRKKVMMIPIQHVAHWVRAY